MTSSRVVTHALCTWLRRRGLVANPGPADGAVTALVDLRDAMTVPPAPKGVRVLALLGADIDPALVLMRGYRGYLKPQDDPELLPRALAAIARGNVWAERSILERLSLQPRVSEPTLRERQVLRLLARGHSNGRIAQELGITVSTVKAHVTSLFAKYGVKSRVELALHHVRSR